MFIEPTVTWAPSGFSGCIWPDTKIVLKNREEKTDKRNPNVELKGQVIVGSILYQIAQQLSLYSGGTDKLTNTITNFARRQQHHLQVTPTIGSH